MSIIVNYHKCNNINDIEMLKLEQNKEAIDIKDYASCIHN